MQQLYICLDRNASQEEFIERLKEAGIEDILRDVGGGRLKYDTTIAGYPDDEPKATKEPASEEVDNPSQYHDAANSFPPEEYRYLGIRHIHLHEEPGKREPEVREMCQKLMQIYQLQREVGNQLFRMCNEEGRRKLAGKALSVAEEVPLIDVLNPFVRTLGIKSLSYDFYSKVNGTS